MEMEISLEAIISVVTLFFGGGGLGIFFTWKYARKKAEAEAERAKAEAERAKAEAAQADAEAKKGQQDYYQQVIQDIQADRDYYKGQRDEFREKVDKVMRSVAEWKEQSDQKIRDLQKQVARNGRQLECMRPFLCGDSKCKNRVPVTISDDGEVRTKRPDAKRKGGDDGNENQ